MFIDDKAPAVLAYDTDCEPILPVVMASVIPYPDIVVGFDDTFAKDIPVMYPLLFVN
jgi:hypothetical protein